MTHEKDNTNSGISGRAEAGKEIELRSDEVQEILTRPPHALVRYGISVIGGVLLILFIGSFFFKYPDIVQGNVELTSENPPVWLVAKNTGRIKELLCSDKQTVNSGQILLVIDNTAETQDAMRLIQYLKQIQINDSTTVIPDNMLQKSYGLGEVQSYFSAFAKSVMNYRNMQHYNLTNEERTNMLRQITDRKAYLANLKNQLALKQNEIEIAAKMYEREKKLYNENVNSKYDMETAEQTYLSKKQDLIQLKTSISLAEIESSQMKGSVNKLSLQQIQDRNQVLSDLRSSFRELKTALENWQQNYLLVAPQNGTVTFNSFWKQNQYIKSGDKVLAIVPANKGDIVGKIQLPVEGSGKVQVGQAVNIKVSGYPYLEFGMLKGWIRNKSLVTNDNNYTLEVSLSKGLRTTTGQELKFTGELTGTAEIITEDRSLFERFYSPLKYLVEKSF